MRVEERIAVFNEVRDAPYSIPLTMADIPRSNNCSSKANRLGAMLNSGGIKTRQRLCRFKWQVGALPSKLLAKNPSPEGLHQFLEALIPETDEWVTVDATWDTKLAKAAGLPFIEWDGLSATRIALKPLEILPQKEGDMLMERMENNPQEIEKILDKNQEFFSLLNKWFEKVRNGEEPDVV